MIRLKELMEEEYKALMELLLLLKDQYLILLSGESIPLDMITENINNANKLIAKKELIRREFQKENHINLQGVLKENIEIDKQYKDIKALIYELQTQKEANEQVLKQRLNFTNKILALINPNRSVSTYDARGNFRR